MKAMTEAQYDRIWGMCRCELEAILASAGIQCYDNESDGKLRAAVRCNVRDGTIDLDSWEYTCCGAFARFDTHVARESKAWQASQCRCSD